MEYQDQQDELVGAEPGRASLVVQERCLVDLTKFEKPKSFQEAWNHKDAFRRKKWRKAIRKEFKVMIKLKLWQKA